MPRPIASALCSCPESQATVMVDLRELGPTLFFAPPRIFENILTQVMIRMEDAGWAKRSCSDISSMSQSARVPRSLIGAR